MRRQESCGRREVLRNSVRLINSKPEPSRSLSKREWSRSKPSQSRSKCERCGVREPTGQAHAACGWSLRLITTAPRPRVIMRTSHAVSRPVRPGVRALVTALYHRNLYLRLGTRAMPNMPCPHNGFVPFGLQVRTAPKSHRTYCHTIPHLRRRCFYYHTKGKRRGFEPRTLGCQVGVH